MAVIAAIKGLVVSDEVATLEARSAASAVELADIGASQIVFERALLDAEKHGDIKAGDAAVAKLESATKQIDRLRVRRSAIAEALTTAKAGKAATAKAGRVDALKAEAERARLAADAAEKLSVSLCLKLASALGVYANEGAAERAAATSLERETGTAVAYTRRYVSNVTSEALRQAATRSTFDISLPAMK